MKERKKGEKKMKQKSVMRRQGGRNTKESRIRMPLNIHPSKAIPVKGLGGL
jgi:hypothetical protein